MQKKKSTWSKITSRKNKSNVYSYKLEICGHFERLVIGKAIKSALIKALSI